MPGVSDLLELTDVTRRFLESFMFEEFSSFTTMTTLDDFITKRITSSFMMDGPIVVDFMSFARFDEFSQIIPEPLQISEAVEMAFQPGTDSIKEYLEMLKSELPPTNPFHDTVMIQFRYGEDLAVDLGRKTNNSTSTGASVGIAAAAVAAVLLSAGIVLYKRRAEDEDAASFSGKKGDATVAGETYAGETYDGTASLAASSLDYLPRDSQPQARSKSELGLIREFKDDPEEDDSSVRPMYGNTEEEVLRDLYEGVSYEDESEEDDDHEDAESVSLLHSDVDEEIEPAPTPFDPQAIFASTLQNSDSEDGEEDDEYTEYTYEESSSISQGSGYVPKSVAKLQSLLEEQNGEQDPHSSSDPPSSNHDRPRTIQEIEQTLLKDDNESEIKESDQASVQDLD